MIKETFIAFCWNTDTNRPFFPPLDTFIKTCYLVLAFA